MGQVRSSSPFEVRYDEWVFFDGHQSSGSGWPTADMTSDRPLYDPLKFGTHSMRRTKATLIYRRTGNLRAVQLLLGHTKIASTVRYRGIEIDDAIEIAEKIDF